MRIVIFLSSKLYIRNYIANHVFCLLSDHQLTYVVQDNLLGSLPDGVTEQARVVSTSAGLNKGLRTKSFDLNNLLLMYAKSSINRNFLFRFRRELIPRLYAFLSVPRSLRVNWRPSIVGRFCARLRGGVSRNEIVEFAKSAITLFREFVGILKYSFVVLVVKAGLQPLVSKTLWRLVPLNSALVSVFLKESPSLVVIPTSIVDVNSYEVMRVCSRLSMGKVLLLVDNWDNLSSKSSFYINPDYVGVMSPQGKEFAVHIHGMNPEDVFVIGTPRFEVYRDYLRVPVKNGESEVETAVVGMPYILFAGCAVPFDEIGALRALSSALEHNKKAFPPNTKILYRPHPWGRREMYLRALDVEGMANVVVDPQISANRKLVHVDFQPALDYYPRLLADALIVVCPLSTMMLEASILRKQVVALAHEDGISLLSPNRILENYRHFDKFGEMENVTVVSDLSDLAAAICGAMVRGDLVSSPKGLDYYLDFEDPPYPDRLKKAVDTIADRECLVEQNCQGWVGGK